MTTLRSIYDFQYEDVRELIFDYECGDIMGWNLRGHGYSPDDIDEFLIVLGDEGYLNWRLAFLDVQERWCRKVPMPDGGWRYAYTDQSGRGAYAVTSIERAWDL